MLNTTTQKQKLKTALLDAYKGGYKLNRIDLQKTLWIVDVPTRIFELKEEFAKEGYEIKKTLSDDNTANYYLEKIGSKKEFKKEKKEKDWHSEIYTDENGLQWARIVPNYEN